jgi:hypothetical protein
MYYADAIEVLVKNGDYASQELRALEKQAVRIGTFFGPSLCPSRTLDELLALELLGTCLEPIIHNGDAVFPNVGGPISLLRLIVYEIRSSAPAATRANAIAEFADWHLLSAHRVDSRAKSMLEVALALYERANRELQQGVDAQETIAQVFSSEVPVTLLTVHPNPFVSAATAERSRYIDVAFVVTRYGRGERVEILETSVGTTRAEKRDLLRLIESTSFRPRFVDGEVANAAPVVLRYHLRPSVAK